MKKKWIINETINGHVSGIALFDFIDHALEFCNKMNEMPGIPGIECEYTIKEVFLFESAEQALNNILKVQ